MLFTLVLFNQHHARAATVTFEGFPDSAILTSQIPGLSFGNTIILSSGITLNEFEFPPRSGTNVASDNGGPITITFSPAVTSFSGYFTYAVPLILRAFNGSNAQVATATSHFSNNEALSGTAGSSPNELLQVSSAGGIARLTITGDPSGSSFTMDDIGYTVPVTSIPLLSQPLLAILALLLAMASAFLVCKTGCPAARIVVTVLYLLPVAFGVFCVAAQEHGQVTERTQSKRVSVSTSRIMPNTPTPLTLHLAMNGRGLISDSGNLIRLLHGDQPVIIGQLFETSLAANTGRRYTGQIIITGKSGEEIRLLVSVASRGAIRRTLSEPAIINVATR
jgi:hypothetical protein